MKKSLQCFSGRGDPFLWRARRSAAGLKTRGLLLVLLTLASLWTTEGYCIAIYAPTGLDNVEGNANNNIPFHTALSSVRYQQVYNAPIFSSLNNFGGGWITALTFRVDATAGDAFRSTLPSVQINFSTSPNSDATLSPLFANNVGPNDTVVFGPGPLTLSSRYFHMAAPQPWDIRIPLTAPFFYDPRQGHLLLDVRNFSGGFTTLFDASNLSGDRVGRVWNIDVNSTSGFVDTVGLVTLFEVTPVPEPGTWLLLAVGVCCIGLFSLARTAARAGRLPPRQSVPAPNP